MNYKVYQGDELKQTVTSKTAVMNGLQPNQSYEFGVQPSDGTRDGTKVTTSVTTRGIRFNIPKTLTVGSTITLRYEEYPLGIVPIGNEPSGYFGGGNRQNLSAKVISTANGSSVVEVGGNVIDVGGKNLIIRTGELANTMVGMGGDIVAWNGSALMGDKITVTPGEALTFSRWGDNTDGNDSYFRYGFYTNADVLVMRQVSSDYHFTIIVPANATNVKLSYPVASQVKLERGETYTPYASFVDGDTFTEQPDGTYALFSEHKALYY